MSFIKIQDINIRKSSIRAFGFDKEPDYKDKLRVYIWHDGIDSQTTLYISNKEYQELEKQMLEEK